MDFFSESPSVHFEIEELDSGSRAIHEQAKAKAKARARKYLIAEAELLEAIMEVDRRRIYEAFGCPYLTPYCVEHLDLSEDVAACFVRVARKSVQVPELCAAIDEGRLTGTKAKTIASVVQKNPELWIEKAATLTKDKLEREVAAENPSARKPEKAKSVGADRVRVEFELNEEEMELFRRAQELQAQKAGRIVSLAETQVVLLKCYLEKNDPVRKAERAKKKPPADRSQDRPRPQSIPAAVKHEVHRRDRGRCQARNPNGTTCGETKWIHLHHLKPKNEGGTDTAENLVTLCSAHHRHWHKRVG